MTYGLLGEFRIGEDIAIALDAISGDPGAVVAISAAMKPASTANTALALDDAAQAITLVVTPQVPASAGWTISLPAASSAGLEPGLYGIDARLDLAGAVELTERSAFISLTRAALA